MMRRSLYSKDPKHSSPLIDIMWDRTMLLIEAKAGTLDVKSIGPMFARAMSEITEAIKTGKANGIKKSDGGEKSPGAGTAAPDQGVEPS